jgi:membrane protease YdiL (CAAX protease family)
LAAGIVGILKAESGRMRVGWRILLFLLLLSLFVVLLSLLPFRGLPWETIPVLLGGLLAGWILLALDGRGTGALGFYLSPSVPRETLLGLGLGIAVSGSVVLGIALVGGVRWTAEPGGVWEFFRNGALALWFFTLPAAMEEVLFRGYFFQALAESWGALQALWATSLLFAVLHLGNPNLSPVGIVNIALAGLFLGAVYLRTVSLWWATGAHLGWNWTLGFLADLPVSGLEMVDSPLHEGVPKGTELLSGGAFGPEGSVVASAVLALASWWVWKGPGFKPGRAAIGARPLFLPRQEVEAGSGRTGGIRTPDDSRREA